MTTIRLPLPAFSGDFAASTEIDLADGEFAAEITILAADALRAPHFTFSQEAEDNGTAGALDLLDGIIFEAPEEASGTFTFGIKVVTPEVEPEGIEGLVEGDTVDFKVYINSTVALVSEEGALDVVDIAEPAWNLLGLISLQDTDVVRVVLDDAGTVTEADLADIAEGGSIQIW